MKWLKPSIPFRGALLGGQMVSDHNICGNQMGSFLSPLQLGYDVLLGAEAAIHSARYQKDLPPDHVLAKLDFNNAFNMVRRDKVLEAACKYIPELYPYLFSCCSAPSTLSFEEAVLLSADCVQQGDPLGPLLFCPVIH